MKIKYTAIALLSLTLFSCTDGFDRDNENPNNPVNVPTYGIYNNATKGLVGTAIRGSFGSARMTLPWVQYSAQRNYTEEDRYQYREGTPVSVFNAYYQQANNFKKIIELNTDPTTKVIAATYGSNDMQIASSRIFLAYAFQNLVDMFGDIPYWSYGNKNPDFEALDIDNLTPKYAKQEDIYADLLKELEEAVAMIDANPSETVIFYNKASYTGENVFKNDISKLRKFANSLRLRIATRLKNSPLSGLAQTHITSAIASGVMQSNSDSVGVIYEENSINPAPIYIDFFMDNRTDYTVSKPFIDLLKGQVATSGLTTPDPRLQKVVAPIGISKGRSLAQDYTETTDLTKYQGMPFGITSLQTSSQRPGASLYSYSIFKQNYTEYLMTYAEVEFLLAEANGWDNTNYVNGVTASMEQWGVNPADIATYVGALPAVNEENVMNQKYIALFMQPYEAWSEYRRTGFPTFLIKPGDTVNLINPIGGSLTAVFTITPAAAALNGNMTDLPARIRYPYLEQTLNKTNYEAAVSRLGGDTMQEKLIWDNN